MANSGDSTPTTSTLPGSLLSLYSSVSHCRKQLLGQQSRTQGMENTVLQKRRERNRLPTGREALLLSDMLLVCRLLATGKCCTERSTQCAQPSYSPLMWGKDGTERQAGLRFLPGVRCRSKGYEHFALPVCQPGWVRTQCRNCQTTAKKTPVAAERLISQCVFSPEF